jgi:hypothetical protein
MFTRMFLNLSDRFQPWDTGRQFAARVYLSQSEKSSTGFLTLVSESIGLLSLSSPSPSASHMQVSGSPSPVARTKRMYPAVSSLKRSRCVEFQSDLLGEQSYLSPYRYDHEQMHGPVCWLSGR